MKRDNFTLPLALLDELIIDNFAGGGGASEGIEEAFGRPVDIAINHNAEALAMHAANHPHTAHYCESVWDVDPIEVTRNQPVGLVWLSPDCKHFSKAKGGKPVEKKIRGLAWVALRWAAKCKPRVIMLENVEEFRTWGPLQIDAEGNARPDPSKKGQTFRSFVRQLEGQGYAVDWRELRACDYGAPTIRKRFFLVARRDGLPICWPKPTHGAPGSKEVKSGKLQPWRTAAECIDWSIPCPSIFERKKPLAEATLRRIAKGVMRYVVESGNPFIVPQAQDGAYVAPTLVQTGYGEREGQAPRALDIGKPLGTVVGGAAKHALVSAFLAKHYTGVVGSDLRDGLGTITSSDHHSLVTAHMVTIDNQSSQSGQSAITAPLKTTVTENRHALVAAHLVHMGHGEGKDGGKRFSHGVRDIEDPLNTVTASGVPGAIVTSSLIKLRGTSSTAATDEPLHTVSAGGQHHAEVRAFLLSYYGTDQDPQIGGPLATVTSRDRFGLVTIKGQDYQIVDIGLRMLSPRELFHAQGFPADYIIGDDAGQGLHLTKSAQVRMCGNSVCPPLSEALVRANFAHEALIYGSQAA
jgi:DNA (cytosine-5)-methyltransferase 1